MGRRKITQRIGAAGLRLTRWQTGDGPPDLQRYVAIAVPHTSNWDLPYMLLHAWYHELPISWLGKHTIFRGPTGGLFRRLGGIPVRRDSRSGMVESIAERYAEAERRGEPLVIVVPPEGTRRKSDHWKSGFYEIAKAANVPIVVAYLDYERRIGGFGPVVEVSDDVDADLAAIREFVSGLRGKYPGQESDVVFRRRPGA